MLGVVAGSLVVAILSAPAIAAPSVAANCGNVQILSDQMTAGEAEAYCRYAVKERQKVDSFWGATWKEPIRIHVDRTYRISRALIPGYRGNRGFMEMPLRVVRSNESALLHEIVHIYAPNDNRFLAEGLAVYLHHKLGGNEAFPNFGKSLDALRPGDAGPTLHGEISFAATDVSATNVVGILEGSDPALRGEYVALGAHNDAIGIVAPVDHRDTSR